MNLEHMLKEVLVSEGAVCRFMEPMSSHTTFRIGGPAEAYVCPGNEDELGKVICMCREHDIPWNVLGLSLIHIWTPCMRDWLRSCRA